MSETDELLGAFQRVCVGAIDARDVALLETGGSIGRFTGVYRELVRARLRDLVAAAHPRTTRAIGRASMDALADRHLEAMPPQSRFFREHAESFARWAVSALPPEPPFSRDLLRLEAAQWPANYRPSPAPEGLVAFDLELVAVPSATLTLLTTEWSVHAADRDPERGEWHLAIYRRPDHLVETRWMAPIWASLLAKLAAADGPAIDAVRATLAQHERVADAAFVDEMTTFVAALIDNGALLGSLPSGR
jgi:hypothetical protein